VSVADGATGVSVGTAEAIVVAETEGSARMVGADGDTVAAVDAQAVKKHNAISATHCHSRRRVGQ
jgi:hypothetical protein